jgi:phosphatidylserine/phosphatidylglycerophosphate/cardiolipin synthase-like enzyme
MSDTGNTPQSNAPGNKRAVVCGIGGLVAGAVLTFGAVKIISPSADSSSTSPSPVLKVCFSPNERCTDAIVQAIDEAKYEILVQAYYFTSAPIAEALIRAHNRTPSVNVRVLMDRDCAEGANKGGCKAPDLRNEGIQVRIDVRHKKAHNKVMIIDGRTVITGSFNFTGSAETANAENLLFLRDTGITARYRDNWDRHWDQAEVMPPTAENAFPAPITPDEAARRVGEECTVDMTIDKIYFTNDKVFIHSRGYQQPGNFPFVFYPSGIPRQFKSPADFYKNVSLQRGKTIRVWGLVTRYHTGEPQIKVQRPGQLPLWPK